MSRALLLALGVAAGLAAGCPGQQGAGDDLARDAADPVDAAVPWSPPLGGHHSPDGTAVHFRVAAPRASRVEVWVYAEPLGADAAWRAPMVREPDSGIWAVEVPAAELAAAGVDTIYYGYRAWGPSWEHVAGWAPGSDAGFVARVTGDGDRMNPNKLLIDPYALEISHDPTNPAQRDARAYRTDDEHRALDSGPVAPKSIVLPRALYAGDTGAAPARPLRDDVIYEVHLRGLTAADEADPCRGTYAAAGARAAELAALGVTAVELLPVQETWNDGNDIDPTSASGDNYWGYSTLAFFAPDRRYACDRSPGGPTREVRAMVRAFHDAGLKVFVDVVYNHTAEGGGGSLLSWRGLDNATYYELDAAGTGFVDHTGVGANSNVTSEVVRDLVVDSLRWWHESLGVDGFRFDLASVLGNACARGCFRYDPGAPGNLLVRIPDELPDADLIAEPWGIGAGTYQVGNFPAGWSEWNDRFRDTIRQDVNGGAAVTLGWLANRLSGSPELFGDDGRGPAASIDYVVSHDGFNLHDLHACQRKRNDQPWPYGPSGGGSDSNWSSDHGGDPARQRQAARTTLALLLLSAGVPMITGGDEVLHTQRCNNNPYNLDSPAIWLDPEDAIRNAAFLTFTRRLLAFRAAHPILRPRTYRGGDAVDWLEVDGQALAGGAFDDPARHYLGVRLWRGDTGDDARSIYLAYNGSPVALPITLPARADDHAWYRVADTGAWMEGDANSHAAGDEYRMNGNRYDVAAGAAVIFVER